MLSDNRAVATELQVGIVSEGFPEITIREDQVRPLKEAIIDNVVASVVGEFPCFEDRWLSHGAFMLHCATTKDKEWLMSNITNLKPWEGAALRVVISEQLPKWRKTVIYVRSGRSAENILRTMNGKNSNFNAQGWKKIEYREDAGKGDS